MRRLILFVFGITVALVLLPTTAAADSATHTYLLVMDAPNFGVAANRGLAYCGGKLFILQLDMKVVALRPPTAAD